MREELILMRMQSKATRITPACAGRTHSKVPSFRDPRDHPRVCGKNTFLKIKTFYTTGSPPRVREELPALHLIPCFRRITPACAGRTTARRRRGWSGRDHPRVCGKNVDVHRRWRIMLGSPPRVREEQRYKSRCFFVLGITPACAGRTQKTELRSLCAEDHPRVCGKNSKKIPFLCLFFLQPFHESIHFCCKLT